MRGFQWEVVAEFLAGGSSSEKLIFFSLIMSSSGAGLLLLLNKTVRVLRRKWKKREYLKRKSYLDLIKGDDC